jgi:hypothetical protein
MAVNPDLVKFRDVFALPPPPPLNLSPGKCVQEKVKIYSCILNVALNGEVPYCVKYSLKAKLCV